MSEATTKIKRFQWTRGDNFGKLVDVESEDNKMYYFTDGTKIFKRVAEEFLVEVIDDNIPLPGADQVQINPGAIVKKNKSQPTKPRVEAMVESELHSLVQKLSKKNMVDFEPKINLNIPTIDIFKMLIDNIDENPKDLIATITNVAISQIEINKLQSFLKEEITNFLNTYYE